MKNRYSKLKKLVYAFIATGKLWPYFQGHTITLLTDQPMKSTLYRLDTLGHIAKWVIKLCQFDIKFQPWSSIKAQILVFLVKCTILDEPAESEVEP